MNRMTPVIKTFCAAYLCWLFYGCSSGDTAGGGTNLPNGNTVAGKITSSDSTLCSGVSVNLASVIITQYGDSVIALWADTTDAQGVYRIEGVAPGHHLLYAKSANGNATAIDQFVELGEDTSVEISLGDIVISSHVNLIGHVILPLGFDKIAQLRVFIPGTGQTASVDSAGRFRLAGVPQGRYDIAFVMDSVANFTRVDIHGGDSGDIVLRDIEFAFVGGMADAKYKPHETEIDSCFYVSPRHYSGEGRPDWYNDIDTTHVEYFNFDRNTEEFDEWTYDSLKALEYDFVLTGMLIWNDTVPVIVLRRGEEFPLCGELVHQLPDTAVLIIAAVKIRHEDDPDEMCFEIVAFQILPDFMKPPDGGEEPLEFSEEYPGD
jgi:hypothetical protein